jgi:hypothetical protein
MAFWSSWKRGNKPREQYYGGSKEAYEQKQVDYDAGARRGEAIARQGVSDARGAAADAGAAYGRLDNNLQNFETQQAYDAQSANRGFQGSMGDYDQGRGAILAGASAMERDANNMKRDYQQTAQAQFDASRDATQRSALALGSRGGASGLRSAMAGSTNANAAAAGQAQITQAQEMNQLAAAQQQARAAAAGIRSGVGAQDQAAASQFAGRQQNAYGNQANAIAQRSGNVGANAQIAQSAGQLGAQTGAAMQGQYMDSATAMETAALNSSREAEQMRLDRQKQRYSRITDPMGLHGGQ